MFAVIYTAFVKKGREEDYRRYWKEVASYFVKERGAISSTIHKTAEGKWVAYSKWKSKEMRDASWPSKESPVNPTFPDSMIRAIEGLKGCLDLEKEFSETCLEVIETIEEKEL